MTNEEIEKAAAAFFALTGFLEQIAPSSSLKTELQAEMVRFVRSFVSQAYEEAAERCLYQIHLPVDDTLRDPGYWDGYDDACRSLSKEIRALKDSLKETVSP